MRISTPNALGACLLLSIGCTGTIGEGDGDGPRGTGGQPGAGADPDGDGLVADPDNPDDVRIAARVWRLTPAQLDAEVERLFGPDAPTFSVPEGAAEAGITNVAANGVIDIGNASLYVDGARAIGSWVAAGGAAPTRCPNYGEDACIDTLLGWLLRGAFRRPVSQQESDDARALFTDLRASYDYDYAVAGVVRGVLLSPDFLYRTELGDDGGIDMTQYEIANLLAFAVTDRSPDAMLLDAADAGELGDPGVRELHARRLMGDSARVWQRMFWEWLDLDTLYSQGNEVGLDPAIVAQMAQEYRLFVEDVVVARREGLRTLMSASHTFATPELADLYGATHPGGNDHARIELDPLQRGGVLTQGAWLVSHGKDGGDNVVRRGMNLFKHAMCNNDLKPPDGLDVNQELMNLVGPDATVRETSEIRAAAAGCGTCHAKPDPLGLVFENYSSQGRWQTTYPDGLPVESAVTLEPLGSFDNAPALSEALVDDPQLQDCFVRRVAHFLVGIDLGAPAMAEWVAAAHTAFDENGTSLEELLVAFVRHPAFIERP